MITAEGLGCKSNVPKLLLWATKTENYFCFCVSKRKSLENFTTDLPNSRRMDRKSAALSRTHDEKKILDLEVDPLDIG